MCQMKSEIPCVSACPTHPAAVSLVRDFIASEGISANIVKIFVADEAAARELQFRGSPTVRGNGKDVIEQSMSSMGSLCAAASTRAQAGVASRQLMRSAAPLFRPWKMNDMNQRQECSVNQCCVHVGQCEVSYSRRGVPARFQRVPEGLEPTSETAMLLPDRPEVAPAQTKLHQQVECLRKYH